MDNLNIQKINKLNIIYIISIFLITLCIVGLILLYINKNPFAKVEWLVDTPGATSRYTTYTPVLKTNNKIKLGPTIGADFGKLYFKDLNNDGIKEVIIKTDISFHFSSGHTYQYHVLKYKIDSTGLPKFELIESVKEEY